MDIQKLRLIDQKQPMEVQKQPMEVQKQPMEVQKQPMEVQNNFNPVGRNDYNQVSKPFENPVRLAFNFLSGMNAHSIVNITTLLRNKKRDAFTKVKLKYLRMHV